MAFLGNPNVTISAINTSGGITCSRTSGKTPCFIQASASAITATGTTVPYEDLEYSWDFGDCRVGINIAGAYASWSQFPDAAQLNFVKSYGLRIIRLPIAWERIQTSLGAALNTTYLNALTTCLNLMAARGMSAIVEIHNGGGYDPTWAAEVAAGNFINSADASDNAGYKIGTAQVTQANFVDLWTRLSAVLSAQVGVFAYGLMNEPHSMPTASTWPLAAQAAIDAIRAARDTTRIHVQLTADGDSFSSKIAADTSPMTGVDTYLDSSNNLYYERHIYFDASGGGSYPQTYDAQGATPTLGATRAQIFIDWLKANNKQGFFGEFGVPGNDARWITVLNNFLNVLMDNGISGTYWAHVYVSPDGAGSSFWPSGLFADPYANIFTDSLTQGVPQLTALKAFNGEFFTNPVVAVNGSPQGPQGLVTVNANTDQLGPEAVYCYRMPGSYTITLNIRGKNASSFVVAQTTQIVTVTDFVPAAGRDFYFDPDLGSDANPGTIGSPKKTLATLGGLLGTSNTRCRIKRGTVMDGGAAGLGFGQISSTVVSGIRIDAYGVGARPIVKVTSGTTGNAFIMSNGGSSSPRPKSDIVISNIVFQNGGTAGTQPVVNLQLSNTTATIIDVYFDNCDAINTLICPNVIIWGGSSTIQHFPGGWWGGRWTSPLPSFTGNGQAFFGGFRMWMFIFGIYCEGGGSHAFLHHHIYPETFQHWLFRWINFGPGAGRNQCINSNWDVPIGSLAFPEFILISDCNMTGTLRAWDAGNADNNVDVAGGFVARIRILFRNYVVQNSSVHDMAADGQVAFNDAQSMTVRDCLFYNNTLGAVWKPADETAAVLPPGNGGCTLRLYRNKFYGSTGFMCVYQATSGYWTQPQQITDNVLHNTSTAPGQIVLPFSLFPSNGSIIDRNQYYEPAAGNNNAWKDNSTVKTFAQWQTQGLDVNGVNGLNPNWSDPGNGDFRVVGPTGSLVAAGNSTVTWASPPAGTGQAALAATGLGTATWAGHSSVFSGPTTTAVAITGIAPNSGTPGDFTTLFSTLTVSGSNGVLNPGEVVQASNDGISWFNASDLGTGTTWEWSDPAVHTANFFYFARIIDSNSVPGTNHPSQLITVSNAVSAATVTITGLPTGTGAAGDFITKARHVTLGGINDTLDTDEMIQVTNDGVTWNNVVMTTTTSWVYVDQTSHSIGQFTYHARVTNTAGNVGFIAGQTVTIIPETGPGWIIRVR